MTNLRDRLEEELGSATEELLSHRFLECLRSEELNKRAIQAFACEYAVYCQAFPRMLAAVAANVPTDELRAPLIENLWEEHGEGDLFRSHRKLYQRFLRALDIPADHDVVSEASQYTRTFTEKMLEYCINESYLKGLGAVGPGTEGVTSPQYDRLLSGLLNYPFLEREDLVFFDVHIGLDEEHYEEALHIMESAVESESQVEEVIEGARTALNAELDFWNALSYDIGID